VKTGVICVDGWAGRREYPVEIVGETPKRYRVKVLSDARLPRGIRHAGDVVLVPKTSVRLNEEVRDVCDTDTR